jgi:hypothetical protein
MSALRRVQLITWLREPSFPQEVPGPNPDARILVCCLCTGQDEETLDGKRHAVQHCEREAWDALPHRHAWRVES